MTERRGPLWKNRKRAAITGTALDFIKIEVPCPQCLKEGKHDLAELIANDTAACPFCGADIDLTTEDWRSRLADEAEKFKEIKILK